MRRALLASAIAGILAAAAASITALSAAFVIFFAQLALPAIPDLIVWSILAAVGGATFIVAFRDAQEKMSGRR